MSEMQQLRGQQLCLPCGQQLLDLPTLPDLALRGFLEDLVPDTSIHRFILDLDTYSRTASNFVG